MKIATGQHQEKCAPDFFVVGAAKSATSSLYSYLQQHPQVFLPLQKEIYFFSFNGETPRFKLADGAKMEPIGCSVEDYFGWFEQCPLDAVAGDTTSWNLYRFQEFIANAKKSYGSRAQDIKIIMILRNPIYRAWSHYSMHKGQGLIDIPFREAIEGDFPKRVTDSNKGFFPGYDYIGFGMYAEQVQAFFDAFSLVKIFLYEEVVSDVSQVVNDIFRFVGLEPLNDLEEQKRKNISGAPRSWIAAVVSRLLYRPYRAKTLLRGLLPASLRYHIKMNISRTLFRRQSLSESDRQKLADIYRDDITRLGDIIQKDLSGWLSFSTDSKQIAHINKNQAY